MVQNRVPVRVDPEPHLAVHQLAGEGGKHARFAQKCDWIRVLPGSPARHRRARGQFPRRKEVLQVTKEVRDAERRRNRTFPDPEDRRRGFHLLPLRPRGRG